MGPPGPRNGRHDLRRRIRGADKSTVLYDAGHIGGLYAVNRFGSCPRSADFWLYPVAAACANDPLAGTRCAVQPLPYGDERGANRIRDRDSVAPHRRRRGAHSAAARSRLPCPTVAAAAASAGGANAEHLPLPEAQELEPARAAQRPRHPGRDHDLRRPAHGQRQLRLRAAPGRELDRLARRAHLHVQPATRPEVERRRAVQLARRRSSPTNCSPTQPRAARTPRSSTTFWASPITASASDRRGGLPRPGRQHVCGRARPAECRLHLVDQLALLRHPARAHPGHS